MSITNGYCSLTEIKDRLDITDTDDDTKLEVIVQAVSRSIDALTGRRFYSTTADETRVYTAEDSEILFTDEIQTITTLKTDLDGDRTYENTLTTDDYELSPANAALDGKPYTYIEIMPYADYSFPRGVKRGVQIVGTFGYCATGSHPDVVREACLIQSARIFKRKDAPFGVVGSPELGQLQVLSKLDPDVALLLDGVRRVITI